MCTADLDLPVGYCDTVRDAQLEQARETRKIPLVYPENVEDVALGARIALPGLLRPHAPDFKDLLNDILMALKKPRNARLVASYMCILYNIAERARAVDKRAALDQKRIVAKILGWYRLALKSIDSNKGVEEEGTDGKSSAKKGDNNGGDFDEVTKSESSLELTLISMRWHAVKRAIDWYWYYIYEQPWPFYRTCCLRVPKSRRAFDFHDLADKLHKNGVAILPSYVKPDDLKQLQSDFNSWCAKKKPDVKKVTKVDGGLKESHLSQSLELSCLSIDPFLVGLASHYLGKTAKLAYGRGYRQEPIPHERYRAFQWHHDLKRKMVKIMILLTDVPAYGQRMDYAVGTHRTWHEFHTQLDTTFEEKDIDASTVMPCCGRAGTVIVFDPNGLHTGTRNDTVRRDQYTFNYTAGHGIFPLRLHPEAQRRAHAAVA